MKKWLKIFLGTTFALTMLIVLACLSLIYFVNPNDYKSHIETFLYEKTGLHVHIQGKIQWKFFPAIGQHIRNVTIKNKEGEQLAYLGDASMSVQLLPLLWKSLLIDQITATQININIIQFSENASNWSQAMNSAKKQQPLKKKKVSEQKPSSPIEWPFSIRIKRLAIKEFNLHFHDTRVNQRVNIKNASLIARNIANNRLASIALSGLLKSPDVHWKCTMTSQGQFNYKKNSYHLNKIKLTVNAERTLIQDDTFFTVTGNISWVDHSIDYNLTSSPIYIQRLLPVTPSHNTMQTAAPAPKKQQAPLLLPVDFIKSLNMSGQLTLARLTYDRMTASNIHLTTQMRQGKVHINPIRAELYDGDLHMNIMLDVTHPQPTLTAKVTTNHINLKKLSVDIDRIRWIQGELTTQSHLMTKGNNKKEWLEHLNGNARFNIINGQIEGTNINHLLCQAVAYVRRQNITKQNWPQNTKFSHLEGTWTIQNGIARGNDLLAKIDQMQLRGQGHINFVTQWLDYQLSLTVTGASPQLDEHACTINSKYANIAWPVLCQGPWSSKSHLCSIDVQRMKALSKLILTREIQDKVNTTFKHYLQKPIKQLKDIF